MSAKAAFVEGFLLYLSIICSIGPQNAFLIQQGIIGNRPLHFALASAAADISLISAGAAGFGLALLALPGFQLALSLAGAFFLFLYGARALASAMQSNQHRSPDARGCAAGLGSLAAITLLNPIYYVDNLVVIGGTAALLESAIRSPFLAGACCGAVVWFFGLVGSARRVGPVFAHPIAEKGIAILTSLLMFWMSVRILMKVEV
jgi:L-lysine exporter family protein LysE/ArgO